jgi:pyruvate dehydrogenase E1 component alpha subunit
MGREGAVCHGVGGSQHVYRQRSFLSTGVQGESLAVAAGVAFHFKRYGRTEVALVYVGDGTWGEGIVYESLNLAALWQLPLVVVVENNRIAQSTPITMQMAGSIEGRVRAFGIEYERVSISDINAIRQHLAVQFERSRHRRSPLVIEFETFRLGPHSKGDDTRTHAQIEDVRRRDVVTRYAAHFPEQHAEAQASVDREMDAVVKDLLGRGPSTWGQA